MNLKGKNTLFCFVNIYNNGEELTLVLVDKKVLFQISQGLYIYFYMSDLLKTSTT